MAPRGYTHHWRGPDFEPDPDNDNDNENLNILHDPHTTARTLLNLRAELASARTKHSKHIASCAATRREYAATLSSNEIKMNKAHRELEVLQTTYAALMTEYTDLCAEIGPLREENGVLHEQAGMRSAAATALRERIATLEGKVDGLGKGETVLRRLREVLGVITQKQGGGEEAREELRVLLAEIVRDEMR